MNQNNEIVKIFMFRNFNIFVETHCMRLETAARKEYVDTAERRMQCVYTLTATRQIVNHDLASVNQIS
ncbi:hypothetical protein KsCSTR_38620 [Candidatus Kuenenia stuttgartiensis]|jgi:hypothetical protein|uniref:Uncharacterized protein n=1 Tax=Kuenenia stuttgartiensis TaxID=174633 RepID=A0A2C9CJ96_KUEST|nr:hypothetical protein KsCSTR_38620 [Candidatus Kuenenia stuttgartiensis]SOH05715.1 hypothetical protein KSMBR1_3238 [Candidatus Kuenenia stuttgartiensis]